jgi:uncharacterized membrane protein required for colicin V production
MDSFDVILILVLSIFMFAGWRKGLLRKLIALICLALSLVVATKFASTISDEISEPLGLTAGTGTTICFILIVCVIMISQAIFYRLVIKKLGEGLWNKIGGLLMGLLQGGLLVSVTLIFLSIYFHYPSDETRSESLLYKPLKNFAPRLFDSINTFFPESEDFYQEIMTSVKKKANP